MANDSTNCACGCREHAALELAKFIIAKTGGAGYGKKEAILALYAECLAATAGSVPTLDNPSV